MLSETETKEMFSSVPMFPNSQEQVGNRMFYVGSIEGFDLKDKEKYNSTLSFFYVLREAWIQKRINAVFILIIKIAFRDNRPLKIRTKALLVYWILTIREKIINICTQSFFPFIKKNNQNV